MIERIFHPVGQGAFYSERHEGFNMVYDCGNWRNSRLSTSVVKQSFKKQKKEVVDILFISHFDFDHVSKIKVLKEHTQIKKVVMPLLHENEKNMLINLYRLLGYNNSLTLLQDPKKFFDKETFVITVNPTDEHAEDNEEIEILGIGGTGNGNGIISINSGTKLTITTKGVKWAYIPHNFNDHDRNKELCDKLIKGGFTVDSLREDSEVTLSCIETQRKKLKEIYNDLEGKINENSMVLYSGPLEDKKSFLKESYSLSYDSPCLHKPFEFNNRIACVYTGDADLNKIDIKVVYKSYWNNVGTIQIPHHGDIKSFNVNILKDNSYVCPISVGNKNTYAHPSSTLKAIILKNNSYPVLVTEDLSSTYIELISLKRGALPSWVKYIVQVENIDEIEKYKQCLLATITKDQSDKENFESLKRCKALMDLCKDKNIDICFTKDKLYL